jgi:hypothetical protein
MFSCIDISGINDTRLISNPNQSPSHEFVETEIKIPSINVVDRVCPQSLPSKSLWAYHSAVTLSLEKNTWPVSASELYRPSDCRLSAKLVQTFADRWCNMVSVTHLYGRILLFLHRSPYFFSQVARQLYSRDWVDPVTDTLLRKSGSALNRIVDLDL